MIITIASLVQNGTGATATGVLKYGGLLDAEVQPEDIAESGLPPEFVLFNSSAERIVASSISISEDPELIIEFENTGTITPDGQVITSRGFDPSIRGVKGAFSGGFYQEI